MAVIEVLNVAADAMRVSPGEIAPWRPALSTGARIPRQNYL
jgi:hypothetical protein